MLFKRDRSHRLLACELRHSSSLCSLLFNRCCAEISIEDRRFFVCFGQLKSLFNGFKVFARFFTSRGVKAIFQEVRLLDERLDDELVFKQLSFERW
jgi:hypothetical protein